MQGTFDKLQQLQDILSRKYAIEREIKEIPRILETKTEMLNRLKKSYIEKNEEFEQSKERIKHLRYEMTDAEKQREEFEKRMDVISTQREYEALEKEIRDATEKEQRIRREIQKQERLQEEMAESLQREEQLIQIQEEELKTEQKRVEEESESRTKDLNALAAEEGKLTPGMEGEILFKFERIIRNKSGLGIVPVRNNVCTGCNMILPAQYVNNVRKGDDILFCPYCSRILFHQVSEGEEEQQEEAFTFDDEQVGGLADLVDDDFDDEA